MWAQHDVTVEDVAAQAPANEVECQLIATILYQHLNTQAQQIGKLNSPNEWQRCKHMHAMAPSTPILYFTTCQNDIHVCNCNNRTKHVLNTQFCKSHKQIQILDLTEAANSLKKTCRFSSQSQCCWQSSSAPILWIPAAGPQLHIKTQPDID